MKKIIAAVSAAALLASAPAVAQTATAPAPATESVGNRGANAQFAEMGPAAWIVGAIVVGLVIWGIVELVDDDNDEPVSP